MSLVVLDADVASALLRRRVPNVLARQFVGHVLAITFITVGELEVVDIRRDPRNVVLGLPGRVCTTSAS